MAVTPVRAEDDIAGGKVGANAGGDGFLSDICVASAMHQAALVRTSQLFLHAPNQQHGPIKGQQNVFLGRSHGRSQKSEIRNSKSESMQDANCCVFLPVSIFEFL